MLESNEMYVRYFLVSDGFVRRQMRDVGALDFQI